MSKVLQNDDCLAHSNAVMKRFLVEISHPPCSPDIAPADTFIFPGVKTASEEADFRMSRTARRT
jgi:hypothetical protein